MHGDIRRQCVEFMRKVGDNPVLGRLRLSVCLSINLSIYLYLSPFAPPVVLHGKASIEHSIGSQLREGNSKKNTRIILFC